MEYNINEFRNWLENNVTLSAAYSNRSLRVLIAHILNGRNYRLITERNTKDKLFLTYLWLIEIYENARREFGDNWKQGIMEDLLNTKSKTIEQKNLLTWLIGLPQKTANNLDIKGNFPEVLKETEDYFSSIFERIGKPEKLDLASLLLIAGAATLTIRGSDKSKVGKQVERVLIKSALTILGFTLNENFWINIERDAEVGREADAEVQTRRGRIIIEVGLIAAGNQEVIEDKIGRVGRNGIILFDKIGKKSNIHGTALDRQVNLIQLRDGQPLVELHRILSPLVAITLNDPPQRAEDINRAVAELPDEIFEIGEDATDIDDTDEEE